MAEQYRVRVLRGRTVTTIELSGELDLSAQDAIRQAVQEALAAPVARRLLMDVRDVTYVDSVALHATFVLARAEAATLGMSFHVLPSPTVRAALELTGLDDVLREPDT